MKTYGYHIYFTVAIAAFLTFVGISSCGHNAVKSDSTAGYAVVHAIDMSELRKDLYDMIGHTHGEIGVALIMGSGDTLTVNNYDIYPLMSVFKLHQSVALCHEFEQTGQSIDSLITVDRNELNPDTWSPMLKDYIDRTFRISVGDLMRFALIKSDNNASNLMFDRFVNVATTDSVISTMVPQREFRLKWKEADMQTDHLRSYDNHSSPFSTATLLNRMFTDSILSPVNQRFICQSMLECATGTDRISAALADKPDVTVAHKTGSGYINGRGQLIAHNDAAFVRLPDGRSYTLVVFVKDFSGNEQEASAVISRISAKVYDFVRAANADI